MYEENRREWRSFGRLLKKADIPWIVIAVAFAISLASARLSVLFPDYSIKFFEEGEITRRTIMTGIGILVIAATVSLVKSYIEAWLRTDISMRLRDTVLSKILFLKMSDVNEINPRELISRTANDTGMLSDFLVTVLMVIAGEVFHFFLALNQIRTYSINLLIVQLIFIPLSLLAHWLQGGFAYRLQYGIQLRLSNLTEYLSERLMNIPLIKIFTREDTEIKNGDEHIDIYSKVRIKASMLDVLFVILEEALRLSNRIAAILYGGLLVRRGAIGIGTWIAYYMLAEQAALNLDIIAAQWPVLKGVQGAVTRTAEIMELDGESSEGDEIRDEDGEFIFDDYRLSLGGQEILKGISTKIGRNGTVAVVGRSGSGKSTLLNALIRFYEPDTGSLRVGSQNAVDVRPDTYRKQFAYVFQDVRLFSGSIRYNLCYGAGRDISDDVVMAACKRAGLEDFINRQEDGLDTEVSEGGANLSGGELQRIGLARAILREPDIILLDEATANLDAETERKVLDDLARDAEARTVVMVTHNMHIVKDADRIIFMKDGKIEAEGSHEYLLENCSGYREIAAADGKEEADA